MDMFVLPFPLPIREEEEEEEEEKKETITGKIHAQLACHLISSHLIFSPRETFIHDAVDLVRCASGF